MATNRNTVLANGYTYHVYNRGVEKRQIFMNAREYGRFLEIIDYYQYKNPPIRFSQYRQQKKQVQIDLYHELCTRPKIVQLYAFCLMPNHFHLLIHQNTDLGVTKFMANISNSYSKFFNIKYERVGPLFQGSFKAVLIETEEQLLHVSRYIHLNPVASLLIPSEKFDNYPWSSLSQYLGKNATPSVTTEPVHSLFSTPEAYRKFVQDNISYSKLMERMKHLYFEE